MTATRSGFALILSVTAAATATATASADTPPGPDRDREIALALEAAPAAVTAKAGVWVHDRTGYLTARESQNGFVCLVDHRMTSADLGSDGKPSSPLFVVDEKTPHALIIVPVAAAPGHAHGAPR